VLASFSMILISSNEEYQKLALEYIMANISQGNFQEIAFSKRQ